MSLTTALQSVRLLCVVFELIPLIRITNLASFYNFVKSIYARCITPRARRLPVALTSFFQLTGEMTESM